MRKWARSLVPPGLGDPCRDNRTLGTVHCVPDFWLTPMTSQSWFFHQTRFHSFLLKQLAALSEKGISSALHQVPYIWTFKLWTFKDANVRSHVQSRKLVHVSGVHCHVHASSTCGCAFVYFTVQYCIEYSSTVSLLEIREEDESYYPDITGSFFQEGR